MPLRMMMTGLCIVLFLGCARLTPVRVINFKESEFFKTEKDGVKFYCMSDFYVNEVLQARIKEVGAK